MRSSQDANNTTKGPIKKLRNVLLAFNQKFLISFVINICDSLLIKPSRATKKSYLEFASPNLEVLCPKNSWFLFGYCDFTNAFLKCRGIQLRKNLQIKTILCFINRRKSCWILCWQAIKYPLQIFYWLWKIKWRWVFLLSFQIMVLAKINYLACDFFPKLLVGFF